MTLANGDPIVAFCHEGDVHMKGLANQITHYYGRPQSSCQDYRTGTGKKEAELVKIYATVKGKNLLSNVDCDLFFLLCFAFGLFMI